MLQEAVFVAADDDAFGVADFERIVLNVESSAGFEWADPGAAVLDAEEGTVQRVEMQYGRRRFVCDGLCRSILLVHVALCIAQVPAAFAAGVVGVERGLRPGSVLDPAQGPVGGILAHDATERIV